MTSSSKRNGIAVFAVCALALAAAACGDDGAPAPAGAPVLTIHNETDCNVHIRFDNGNTVASIAPGSTQEYSDERLADYRYMQVESTMAIFRNLELAPIREDGWAVTISDALGDSECVDVPGAPT